MLHFRRISAVTHIHYHLIAINQWQIPQWQTTRAKCLLGKFPPSGQVLKVRPFPGVLTEHCYFLDSFEKHTLKTYLFSSFISAISKIGVTLHAMPLSPPCGKILFILKNYDVKFTSVSGKKKGSEYKKVPVLVIGDKQINDSEIITAVLAKVLDTEYTQRESEIEKLSTSGLMISLELAVMKSTKEMQKCGCFLGGCIGYLLWTIACCVVGSGAAHASLSKKFPDVKSPSDYGKDYAVFLSTDLFFHGDKVGVIDCSLYGLLTPFSKCGNEAFNEFINADPLLAAWWERMTNVDLALTVARVIVMSAPVSAI